MTEAERLLAVRDAYNRDRIAYGFPSKKRIALDLGISRQTLYTFWEENPECFPGAEQKRAEVNA